MKLFYLFIKRNPWNFEWELMREWVGWVETPLTWWGERWGHHKFVAAFPSYKKRGESTLSSHTCCHLSPPTRCSTSWSSAWRSHDHFVSPPHHAVVLLEFRGILYFRCPAGSSERRSLSSRKCDRSWKRCRIAAHIFTILRSVWVRLHHQRDLIS